MRTRHVPARTRAHGAMRIVIAATAAAALVAACSSAGDPASGAASASPAPVATAAGIPSSGPTTAPVPAANAAFGDPVGDVRCDYGGHDDAYHIHAQIRIVVEGAPRDPDNDIGVDPSKCMYWVHTHDGTGGVIHVEAPQNVTVTLGDFMAVWAVSYPRSPVYRAALAALDAGKLVVDGAPYTGEWRSVALADGLRLGVG